MVYSCCVDPKEPTRVLAIGPFSFDYGAKAVTLQPGTYTWTEPVVFGLIEATKIERLVYRSISRSTEVDAGIADSNADAATHDRVIAQHSAGEID
jgi:hypothetical protein